MTIPSGFFNPAHFKTKKMTFQQGRRTYNRIPRRRLADQPKLDKILKLGKHLDSDFMHRFVDADAWKGLKDKIFGKEFELGVKQVTEQAVIGATSLAGGAVGKVFGLGMEIGAIARTLSGKDSNWGRKNPNVGEWVAINNGVEHVKQKVKKAIQIGSTSMFQDAPLKEEADIEIGNVVSIGFYISEGTVPGTKTVFNFQVPGQEERHLNELMVLDKGRQKVLDGNHVLARLKSIVLGKDSIPVRNDNAVPVDEGAEVVYKGEVYKIVECDGFTAQIKNKVRTVNVDVSQLKRGRVEHTNGWNSAKNTNGGFKASSKSNFHKGQWVWLEPRYATYHIYGDAKYELGVLRLINGAIGDGYYAMDGVRFQTVVSQIRPCPKSDTEWMNTQKAFLRFKIAAVKGIDVSRQKLGRDWILQVLGVKTVGDSDPTYKKKTPAGPVEKHDGALKLRKLGKILNVGDRNEQKWPVRPEDKALDKKLKIESAKELQDKLQVSQTTANTIVENTREPAETPVFGSTSQGSFVFGIVVLCAAIYLVTYT